jgi:hypothetical protein
MFKAADHLALTAASAQLGFDLDAFHRITCWVERAL